MRERCSSQNENPGLHLPPQFTQRSARSVETTGLQKTCLQQWGHCFSSVRMCAFTCDMVYPEIRDIQHLGVLVSSGGKTEIIKTCKLSFGNAESTKRGHWSWKRHLGSCLRNQHRVSGTISRLPVFHSETQAESPPSPRWNYVSICHSQQSESASDSLYKL